MPDKYYRRMSVAMTLILLISMVYISRETAFYVTSTPKDTPPSSEADSSLTIVVDAGHGGIDPGKVSADGIYEKDINLSLALLLEEYLTEEGVDVIMTRTTDMGHYSENSTNKKMEDLVHRLEIINQEEVDLVISLHQNSFSDPSVNGPQVFYYSKNTEAARFASYLQEQLNSAVNPNTSKESKSNNTYYLLTKTIPTTLIVECGFLSNPDEAILLNTPSYQEKMAQVISDGILGYFQEE